ncbi:MAG TPA: hypothetical protein VG652_01295 [Gaiellaceae bacterium]|nr:hypothetical protein [Gaiellaceae bacterium]
MDVDADPIFESEQELARLLEGPSAEAAKRGLDDAYVNREEGPLGPRSLGFGHIIEEPGDDSVVHVLAITDGERQGIIRAWLSNSSLAGVEAVGESGGAHAVARLQQSSGTLPNDGKRYENMILQPSPIRL